MWRILFFFGGLVTFIQGLDGKTRCSYWRSTGQLISCDSANAQIFGALATMAISGYLIYRGYQRSRL